MFKAYATLLNWFLALLAGLLAIGIRAWLDPILGNAHPFILPLAAVILVAWDSGFGPSLFTLLIGMLGSIYFFVQPRYSFGIDESADQFGLLLFSLSGLLCAYLGSSVRNGRMRAEQLLRDSLEQRVALESEMQHRARGEESLREHQQQLRSSESRFRVLVDMLPQLAWTTSSEGDADFFNRRWYEFTGMSFEDSIGNGWIRAIHPEDVERTQSRWAESIEFGLPYQIEYRLRGSDNEYRWFLARGEPQRDERGNLLRWIGTCTDIDDQRRVTASLDQMIRERTSQLVEMNDALQSEIEIRKRAQIQAERMTFELQRSNEELEKFAYVASHDLQEPLRKIQAFGDRLANKVQSQLDESGQDYLHRMLQAATRMRRLIEDLLRFSRVSTKAFVYSRVDLNRLLLEVLSDLEVTIAQQQAIIDYDELPEIDGDPLQMRQLLQNLLGNSLKFHQPGEPPRIEISYTPVQETLGSGQICEIADIRIRDYGIGFDMQYLGRIFQVFQRLHGRNEYEGTGIGLAICRKIVERHAGTITATSEVGRGSTFIIRLPIHHQQEQEIDYAESAKASYDPHGR